MTSEPYPSLVMCRVVCAVVRVVAPSSRCRPLLTVVVLLCWVPSCHRAIVPSRRCRAPSCHFVSCLVVPSSPCACHRAMTTSRRAVVPCTMPSSEQTAFSAKAHPCTHDTAQHHTHPRVPSSCCAWVLSTRVRVCRLVTRRPN